MNTTHNPEDLLRDTLRAKAAGATVDLTFDEIRRNAGTQRRRATRRTALLAAAAVVVAVGAPTAFLLRPTDETPGPAPQPTGSPTPTQAPTQPSTQTPNATLQSIPRGRPPGITYLQDGTVHLDQGGTVPLPAGTAPVNAFTSYHGGWLVAVGAGGPNLVSWYDGTGAKKSEGRGLGTFAVSEDGTRTAYPQSGAIHIGITSGMSDGEQTVPGKADTVWPVGFLRGDTLVYQASPNEVAVDGRGILPGITIARAVSAEDDLVAGEDRDGHTVVVSGSGHVQWQSSDWIVWGFSPDGRYAAATDWPPGGGSYTSVAILDARTGSVVAQHAVPDAPISIGPSPVMDVDGTLLVAVTDGNTLEETVLRLDRHSALTRATEVFPLDGGSDSTYVLFATRP